MGEDNHLKSVAAVQPFKTEGDVAKELKDRLRPLLDQQIALMTEARNHGMQLGWSIAPNNFGGFNITELTVTKQL